MQSPHSGAINAKRLTKVSTQGLGGGRTRARTWDPMIKSRRAAPEAWSTIARIHAHASTWRSWTYAGLDAAQFPACSIREPASCVRDAAVDGSCLSFFHLPDRSQQRRTNAHSVCYALSHENEVDGSAPMLHPSQNTRPVAQRPALRALSGQLSNPRARK